MVFLALIILYLITAFNRETTANNKAGWSPSTTATSTSTSSFSSSSSTSETKTTSTIKQDVPAELVGNWKTADFDGVILTISEDGTMTKNQSNYIVTERVSGYEEVAQGVYRFYPADGSDSEAIGALILVVSVVVTKQHQNLLREFMLKMVIFIHNSGQQPLANSLIR